MADRLKLAQGLRNLPAAAREDLAGREQDIQRGKTVELLRRAGKEMYENPVVNTAIGLSPVLGDIQAGVEAYRSAEAGDWGNAGLNAAGMLPFIPMLGKTVWHGSPHSFDKFDMSKIGTGEGAQAYGHGLYLAESPKVADQYRVNLTPQTGGKAVTNDEATQPWYQLFHDKYGGKVTGEYGIVYPSADSVLSEINAGRGSQFPNDLVEALQPRLNPGSLYKVDLPDEQIAKMLDWDKPLSEQPHVMKFINEEEAKRTKSVLDQRIKTLESMGESHPNAPNVKKQIALLEEEMANPMGSGLGTLTGGEYYDYLRRRDIDPKTQAEMFMQQGIPGIQYLDQASRGAGDGTRNYVVFSDEIPQILERNGTLVNK